MIFACLIRICVNPLSSYYAFNMGNIIVDDSDHKGNNIKTLGGINCMQIDISWNKSETWNTKRN